PVATPPSMAPSRLGRTAPGLLRSAPDAMVPSNQAFLPSSRVTTSGIEVKPVYSSADLPSDLARRTLPPGELPYTRGIHPEMYRSRLWTMRQYAGFGSARQTNRRFRYLLEHGQTGLSV